MLNDYKSTAQNKSRINGNQYSIHFYLCMIYYTVYYLMKLS